MNGALYRGAKPVMWSVVEKTALAEAEVEYYDHTSTTIHVRFPVLRPKCLALDRGAHNDLDDDTWTMPGTAPSRSIATIRLRGARVDAVEEGARRQSQAKSW